MVKVRVEVTLDEYANQEVALNEIVLGLCQAALEELKDRGVYMKTFTTAMLKEQDKNWD